MAGHLAKAGVQAGEIIQEFRVASDVAAQYPAGTVVAPAAVFAAGQKVDVQGTSIGKGFAGTIKRHGFTMGDATHGNSLSHRSPGSIGQRQTPGRVFPGKKMSGHMGAINQTSQNLVVVKVDAERGLIAVRGSIPGAPGGDVVVRPAAKA
jgi:large subunit ribosomal protein L3